MILLAKDLPGIKEWKVTKKPTKLFSRASSLDDREAMKILVSYEQTKNDFYIGKFFEYCNMPSWEILWKMI